ncbi:MAG: LCP family protein [Acidimicrobiales bacterium]|nr:LCP family protein [Acidimicrobiales bacterium]
MPDGPDAEKPPVRPDGLEGLRRLGRKTTAPLPDGDPPERGARRGAHRRTRGLRRRWPHRILVTVNVLTGLSVICAASAYGYVQWRLGQVKRVHVAGLHAQGHSAQSADDGSSIAPFTMLFIGSDTRDLGAGGGAQFGNTDTVSGQRSDSIILVRVVPKTRSLALLSIPRDTLVAIPGQGTTRINVAFNTGTPDLLVTVLDQDFGIQVNHVAELNFDTFRSLADAVGGVQQYFPSPARDAFSLLNIPAAGCYNLVGDQALAFVRSREYEYEINGQWHYQLYPESDLARIQRQQSFVRDLVRKARTVAPTNLIELNSIIGGITKNLTLDSGFTNSLIFTLVKDFRSADLSTIPSYTYPAVNSTSEPGALDPQKDQGQAVIQQWLNVGAPSTPTTSPTTAPATPKPVITVNPSSVVIEVANGSGVGGQAGQAGQDVTSLGYQTRVTSDAPNFGLATTEIAYAPDSLAAARQLQSQLVSGATLVEEASLTPTPYNLELITGKDYKGVIASSGSVGTAASSTTSSTIASPAYVGTPTVDPDSSSIFQGVYMPPGLQKGQVPQTCGE